MALLRARQLAWQEQSIDQYVVERESARRVLLKEMESVSASKDPKATSLLPPRSLRRRPAQGRGNGSALSRRRGDTPGKLVPARTDNEYVDRRGTSLLRQKTTERRRRAADRRKKHYAVPFPDRRLTRSAYEQVFLKLVSGGRLRVGNDVYRPIGMKGWYHAIFRRDSDGQERLLTIDQLLQKMNDWI
jgi:hypothetical protein